jgi:hypothetical protein
VTFLDRFTGGASNGVNVNSLDVHHPVAGGKGMRNVIFIAMSMGMVLAQCSSAPSPVVSPTELPPAALRCRCTVSSPLMAEVEITDDPVTYRREVEGDSSIWEGGLEFHVSTLRTMYRQSPSGPTPPVTFVARVVRSGPGGDLTDPSRPVPVHGLRALATMSPNAFDANVWNVWLYGVNPTTRVSIEGFYQFAAGTPVDRVLDPSEWGNPLRGCNDCSSP